jgi:hypothetical protein
MGCQCSLFWNKHQLIDFALGGNNHSPNTYIGGTERPTSFTCKMNGLPMLCVCVCHLWFQNTYHLMVLLTFIEKKVIDSPFKHDIGDALSVSVLLGK